MEQELNQFFENIKKNFETKYFKISNIKRIEYGLQFFVSSQNWSELVRIYQNKKGDLKIDLSQIKNKEHYGIIDGIVNDNIHFNHFNDELNDKLGYPIIGTDESGKGDYFGPLVAAGVLVEEDTANDLISVGVKDSKLLNDSSVMRISLKIQEICKGKFAIIEISPEKYNDLYEQFRREDKNLNALLAWGHAKAIEEILILNKCSRAVSDQFADEKYILSKLQERGKLIELIQMPKAEKNIAVAAASILARDRYLEKLKKLSNEFKINLPKGASHNVIDVGKTFIEHYGEEKLRKVAKLHFKTTKEIMGKQQDKNE
ncbi:ribonuclease HIII [Methanolinea mesophila]|uniref:ribonuclease HIII n=1 Tax=Methanolinea mesophila TaxID=547055 RepID=UPI001AE46E10|nr:ribonuclease HIII [Methanolinea mesophila]MBP1928941.1 ribonuclease HIII [Methanolinea mesophila]